MPSRGRTAELGRAGRLRRASLRRAALVAALVALPLSSAPISAAEEPPTIVAIVHPDNPVSSLSLAELRHIYQGDRKRWPHGGEILFLLPRPGTPAMHAVLTHLFQMRTASELGQFYLAAIFQQRLAEAPPTAATADAIRIVSGSPQALAVVPRASVLDTTAVKVLEVPGL